MSVFAALTLIAIVQCCEQKDVHGYYACREAFTNHLTTEVTRLLDLSDSQVRQVEEVNDEYCDDLYHLYRENFRNRLKYYRETQMLYTRRNERIMLFLNNDQKNVWTHFCSSGS